MNIIKFRHHEPPDQFWHIWHPTMTEFTLCGIAFDCTDYNIPGIDYYDEKKGKVTCPECISIIDSCKKIKAKDIRR